MIITTIINIISTQAIVFKTVGLLKPYSYILLQKKSLLNIILKIYHLFLINMEIFIKFIHNHDCN